MGVTVVIPARYASTRFPGKPLADLCGKPMIQWVYERSVACELVDRAIVATDDTRIVLAVKAFGGDVVMTRSDHATGTDRLAEVAADLDDDLVVNVQGDEPLIDPAMIQAAVAPLLADSSIPMGTLKTPLTSLEEYQNPNVVKVSPSISPARRFHIHAILVRTSICDGMSLQQPSMSVYTSTGVSSCLITHDSG